MLYTSISDIGIDSNLTLLQAEHFPLYLISYKIERKPEAGITLKTLALLISPLWSLTSYAYVIVTLTFQCWVIIRWIVVLRIDSIMTFSYKVYNLRGSGI